MHDPVGKLVKRPHVVHVCMGCYSRQRFVENTRGRLTQTRDAHPSVYEQVTGASLHMPDVTLHDPDDVGFPDPGHSIGQVLEIEPAGGDL